MVDCSRDFVNLSTLFEALNATWVAYSIMQMKFIHLWLLGKSIPKIGNSSILRHLTRWLSTPGRFRPLPRVIVTSDVGMFWMFFLPPPWDCCYMLLLRDVVDIVAVVMLFLRDVVDIAVVCGKLSTTKPSNRSLQHHPYLSQPLSRSSQSTLLNSPHSHHSVKFVRPFFTTFSLQDNEPRIASSLRHYNYRNCSKIKEGFLHNP